MTDDKRKKEIKITKKTVVCSLVIIGVIIIPLLYSFFYLGAFWDPYSKLQDLPVAVVNLDQGATLNGETRNIGEEMCKSLKKDATLKYVFTSKTDALKGTEGDSYYASIIIPKNFSSSIASADTTGKMKAEIKFIPNEKRNYLATQILKNAVDQIELSLRGKVDGEIVTELSDQLRDTPVQLGSLVDGLTLLSDGSATLESGSSALERGTRDLSAGLNTFETKFNTFETGMGGATSGANQLLAGVSSLDSAIGQLSDGATNLNDATADIDEIRTNAELLAAKTNEFNQGMQTYTQGVDALITSVQQTSTFLGSYVKANPGLMADPAFAQFINQMNNPANAQNIATLKQHTTVLKDASGQIAQGTSLLASGTASIPQLKQGIEALASGLADARDGSAQVAAGAQTLSDGLTSLNNGTLKLGDAGQQLSEGAQKVADGATALSGGSSTLHDGIDSAKSSVSDSIDKADSKLGVLDRLDRYAEEPVTTEKDPIDPVPNYGTAFAPYFLSLSLWVGALIIFFAIYLDADGKFNLLSRSSDKKLLRSFAYLLIGLIQAVFLGVLLKICLGLEIQHLAMYFGACCLVSLVFISIVQFFLVFLKDIGKFLSIALLILQLTSCGGTFPMETVPKFFNVLYPFMPMTYSVGLLKEAISSGSGSEAMFNFMVLAGILAVFMTLTILFSVARKTKAQATF